MEAETARARTLLLVEDEVLVSLAQEQKLKQYGYSVVTARTGEAAVDIATADDTVDLILMDIDLGRGIDGTEAASRILSIRDVPIVFLTGHREKEMVDRVKGITRYGYVLKSAGEFVLMESVTMAFELFEAHRQLARSRDHYQNVVRLSGEIVVQHSADGSWQFVNRAAREFWGLSPDQIPHEDYRSFIHPDDLPAARTALKKMMEEGVPIWGLVNRQKTPRGWRVVEWNSAPLLDEQGRMVGHQAIGRDITERETPRERAGAARDAVTEERETERLLHSYRQGLDRAEDMIAAVDAAGRYTFANRSYLEHYGLPEDGVVGRHVSEVVGGEVYDRVVGSKLTECLRGSEVTFDYERSFPTRGTRRLRAVYSPIRVGDEVVGATGVIEDVTEEERTLDELERQLTRSRCLEAIAQGTLKGASLDEIVAATVDRLHEYFPDLRVAYSTLDDQNILSVLAAVQPEIMPDITGLQADLSAAPRYLDELNAEEPVLIDDTRKDPRVSPIAAALESGSTRAVLDIPVVHSADVVGLLCFDSPTPRTWRDDEIATLTEVARYLSLALRAVSVQQALEASERRYRELTENATDLIYRYEFVPEPHFAYVNQAATTITGYTPEEHYADPSLRSELVHPDDRHLLEKTAFGEGDEALTLRWVTKSGEVRWTEQRNRPVYDGDGRLVALEGVARDVTARETAKRDLEQTSAQLEDFFSVVPDLVCIIAPEGRFLRVSGASGEILGYQPDEMAGAEVTRFLHPDDVRSTLEQVAAIASGRRVVNFVNRYVTKDGDHRWLEWRAHRGRDGMVHAAGRDITARREIEQELERQRWRLENIIRGTNVGTWEWNVQTGETVFNETWAAIAGCTLAELEPVSIRTWLELVHPEDAEVSDAALERHFRGEADYYDVELRMRHKDGSWLWVHDRGRVTTWTPDGRPEWMFGTHADITRRKRTDERIRGLLREKEMLLSEVHHRVKNNMNTLQSLLALQAAEAKNPETIDALDDAKARVQSMAVLYDKLHATGSATNMPLRTYLEPLVESARSLFPAGSRVAAVTEIAELELDTKSLSVIGTIVNELLTNAMKHAFPHAATGTVTVRARAVGEAIELEVADDGVGMPSTRVEREGAGSGLNLVELLVQQMDGTLRIESEGGTRFLLELHPQTTA